LAPHSTEKNRAPAKTAFLFGRTPCIDFISVVLHAQFRRSGVHRGDARRSYDVAGVSVAVEGGRAMAEAIANLRCQA
jgi:hypothetical protein